MSIHQANTASTTEANKAIAPRCKQEGWGTNPNWKAVWDDINICNLLTVMQQLGLS